MAAQRPTERSEIGLNRSWPNNEIYLDLETLRLSHEVPGGWSSIEKFGLAVAVTWDARHHYRHWFENDVENLLSCLRGFSRIITFNGNRFDFKVLSGYASVRDLYKKSFDLFADLKQRLGHRVKLEDVARETLGCVKSGSGLDAVNWWRAGERARVVKYCQDDVRLLIDIVTFARRNGYVNICSGPLKVDWG